MSDPVFTGGGGKAAQGPFTWGGPGPRRVCNTDLQPFPKGTYGDSVAAGYYVVTDAKYGSQQWVLAGEMVHWNGEPDPVRVALQQAVAALRELGEQLGVAP